MGTLAGRTVMITGASSGLGAHFARLCAKAGAQVVVAARRVDRVKALADNIQHRGSKAFPVAMDVTDKASVEAAFVAAESALGPVDTLVANAGVSAPGRSTELALDMVRSVLDTNVLGVF